MNDAELERLRNHPVIKILKYGSEHLWFTQEEIAKGGDVQPEEFGLFLNQLTDGGNNENPRARRVIASFLLGYLNFAQLQHAHEMARDANAASIEATRMARDSLIVAKWSVWISAALATVSIVISIIQLCRG